MIDTNLENFATIVFAENESAEARISIFKELSPYAGNFFSGFELATTSLHSTSLKNAVTLNFYLDDELIQASTGDDLAFSLVSSTLAGGYYKHLIGTISPSEFDEIQIVFSHTPSMPLDTIRVYHLSMMKICADDLECNTGYSLTPSQLPIMFNSGKTGVVGDIGTSLGIQNLWNILSPTNEDIAEIGVQQGTDGSISISIEDLAHLFPTGTLTGFTIGHDPLIDFSTLITNATLKTYLDGILQATISGSSLLDLKLTTIPLASFPEGTHHIGFKAEESFNEIQFIWEGTSHSGPIKIYQVFADTHFSDRNGVLKCTQALPDFNVAYVGTIVDGNVSTNDFSNEAITYKSPNPYILNPSMAVPTVYSDGSYTFTTNVSGLYVFAVNYAKESDPSYYYAQPLYINVLDPEEFDNNPIALYEHYYTQSPNPILIDVMANDIRGNDDGQLASPIITYPIPSEYGSLTPMGNQFLFTPAPDFYGVVPFAYEICETPSNLCATGVVNIFVLPPDLDHIIANDNVYMVKANKSLTIEAPGVLNNDMMASGGSITASRPNITSRLAKNTALQGELNLHLDGSFTYEAPADYNGTEVVEYEVCDEEGQCYKATLYILGTNANPLPVELRYFELVREGTQALLRWETTEEIKFSHFEVERSFDGRKWHSLSKILAIEMPYHYQYSDENLVTGLNYYRLKMVDQDNRFEYSEIKSLEFDLNLSEVAISPNPAVDKIKLHIQDVTTIEKVQLLSSGGQVVFQSSANFSSEINVRHLPAGVYLVVLTHQGGRRTTHKVLIN